MTTELDPIYKLISQGIGHRVKFENICDEPVTPGNILRAARESGAYAGLYLKESILVLRDGIRYKKPFYIAGGTLSTVLAPVYLPLYLIRGAISPPLTHLANKLYIPKEDFLERIKDFPTNPNDPNDLKVQTPKQGLELSELQIRRAVTMAGAKDSTGVDRLTGCLLIPTACALTPAHLIEGTIRGLRGKK